MPLIAVPTSKYVQDRWATFWKCLVTLSWDTRGAVSYGLMGNLFSQVCLSEDILEPAPQLLLTQAKNPDRSTQNICLRRQTREPVALQQENIPLFPSAHQLHQLCRPSGHHVPPQSVKITRTSWFAEGRTYLERKDPWGLAAKELVKFSISKSKERQGDESEVQHRCKSRAANKKGRNNNQRMNFLKSHTS